MIPAAEIDGIVARIVGAYRRRSPRARGVEHADLLQQGWLIAMEALPYQRACAAPIGPYLGRAIINGLSAALNRWQGEGFGLHDPLTAERVPDPRQNAEDMAVGRATLQQALGALSDLDREIATHLLGIAGPAAPATDVARRCGVMVSRVYQARHELARRAQIARKAA